MEQNNAIRAVHRTPLVKLYRDAGVDPIDVAMKKTVCKIVYKGINEIGATVYNEMFSYDTPCRNLRSTNKLLAKVPYVNTKFGEHNVAYHGPVYWNQFPLDIKSCTSFDQFKLSLESFIGFHYML